MKNCPKEFRTFDQNIVFRFQIIFFKKTKIAELFLKLFRVLFAFTNAFTLFVVECFIVGNMAACIGSVHVH